MEGDICLTFAQWAAFRAQIVSDAQWIGAGAFILGFAVSEIISWLLVRYGGSVE